jgi:hypothetical protein
MTAVLQDWKNQFSWARIRKTTIKNRGVPRLG